MLTRLIDENLDLYIGETKSIIDLKSNKKYTRRETNATWDFQQYNDNKNRCV